MKKYLLTLLFICLTAMSVMAGKRTTVIISLDGCRWDYPLWYDTPFLDYMAGHGVEAGLIPSYPSKTFPNHYALATGLYPDHHGIVANSFYDPDDDDWFSLSDQSKEMNPKFWGGDPIWNTAQRQGKHVAVFYWPGSDVKIGGMRPDIFRYYNEQPHLTPEERTELILGQLKLKEEKRPDLIMCYIEQPDANGHDYGPQGKETRRAMQWMDQVLGNLYRAITQLPIASDVNFIVVSDHGMAWCPKENIVPIKNRLKPEWIRQVVGNVPCHIYAKAGYQDSVYHALQGLDHARVWKKQDIPARLHYGTNRRVGDVVVDPMIGYLVQEKGKKAGATHGFDPDYMEMHAVFRAIGPDFRHTTLPHFRNVDIYPLLCHLLQITPSTCDGDMAEIKDMLR